MNMYDEKMVTFNKAKHLLPAYGQVAWLALHQATLLNLDGPRFNNGLVEQFEEWLKENADDTSELAS